MKIADKILFLRKQRGLSQEQLAEQLDISRQSISKWEAGQAIPELIKIVALCEFFNITSDQLIKDEYELPENTNGNDAIIAYVPEPKHKPKNEIMYCTECGKKNHINSFFCGYCGRAFKTVISTEVEEASIIKNDVDIAYYSANLQMQKKFLDMQQYQLQMQMEYQQEQYMLQKQQFESMAKCPRCGSVSLSGNKKGYGIGKGLIGAAMLGPIGLMSGNIGSKKVIVTCMNCGHRFKASKFR